MRECHAVFHKALKLRSRSRSKLQQMMSPNVFTQVPKYVSDEWQKRGPGAEVGKLKVLPSQDVVFESVGATASILPASSGPSASRVTSSTVKAKLRTAMLHQGRDNGWWTLPGRCWTR